MSEFYICGKKENFRYFVDSESSNQTNWEQILISGKDKKTKTKKVKQIIVNGPAFFSRPLQDWICESQFLLWTGSNRLELFKNLNERGKLLWNKYQIDNIAIKDFQAGYYTFCILSKSGKVFYLANSKDLKLQLTRFLKVVPITNPEKSNFNTIRPIPFFNNEENDRKVKSIAMSSWANYFLCEDGKLYGNGYGLFGGNLNETWENLPVLIHENVTRIFSGSHSSSFFFITNKNELFGAGKNLYGQLGVGNNTKHGTPQKVLNWKGSDILEIHCSPNASFLISKDYKIFSCGTKDYNGTGEDKSIFTKIPAFQDKKVIEFSHGDPGFVVKTFENELYSSHNYTTSGNDNKSLKLPKKITLPQMYQDENNSIPFDFCCGSRLVLIYPKHINNCLKDFKNFYESKKFCDSKFMIKANNNKNEKNQGIEIPIHKIIVELRTNSKIEEIQKTINTNNFNKDEIELFLKWVYYDEITNYNLLEKVFTPLNLNFPPQNTIKMDLLKLFNDDESKDFHILIQNGNEKTDNKEISENETEENEKYEKVPVHKIILLIKSGLFRDMFNNLNEEEKDINQIKDYTGKSKESLEILIKYLYTKQIEFPQNNNDFDKELIIEELTNSIEYYQLQESETFLPKLFKN
ncbi:btk-binding protein-related [Anaeramoeba flamelloides]|uniref:Btk-binding protein-related n=1 Tax=Anaeramoeba flamelloides TaxID=1746091 RepID=A0ABQ8ZEA0_9EUKA|nr:btk-binding protein-related [Anaeramoeba flamelloides]